MYICVMVIFPSTILLIFAILDLWLIQYYKMVQKKTHKKLQYTVLMQLFQIKSNGFHPSVFKVQGNKDYVATFMKLLHIPCKFAQSYDARLADDIL